MTRTLSADAVEFRKFLIDRLWGRDSFGYISEDIFLGTCPVCGFAVEVRFHGLAARADLHCQGGCIEQEVANAVGLEFRR